MIQVKERNDRVTQKRILFKELGEKAEKAAEFALRPQAKGTEKSQIDPLEKELEWLAHSQYKVVRDR